MNSIDLSPFYRSSIGYDRVGALIDNALRGADNTTGHPPYNIEVLDENHYAITLAVAGFDTEALDITLENNVLTVKGSKGKPSEVRGYLHQGIADRAFERRFNLAEFVEVTEAALSNGLLTVSLRREIPETMKPRSIPISEGERKVLEHEARSEAKKVGSQKVA